MIVLHRVLWTALFACSVFASSLLIKDFESLENPLSLLTVGVAALYIALGPSVDFSKILTSDLKHHVWFFTYFTLFIIHVLILGNDKSPVNALGYFINGVIMFMIVPSYLLQRPHLLDLVLRLIVWVSGLIAVTCILGSFGPDTLTGSLRVKENYAVYAGFPASAGIIEHPATAGVQIGFGLMVVTFYLKQQGRWQDVVWLVILLLGVFCTQSRSAILGLITAGFFLFGPQLLIRNNFLMTAFLAAFLLISFTASTLLSLVPYLGDYLRVERGTMGRSGAWIFAIEEIAKEPIWGYGHGSAPESTLENEEYLKLAGFRAAGVSFHNTYLSKIYEIGIPLGIMYIAMYIIPFFRSGGKLLEGLDSNGREVVNLIRAVTCCVIVASLVKALNIGGVKIVPLCGTLFLGLGWILPFQIANINRAGAYFSKQDKTPNIAQGTPPKTPD